LPENDQIFCEASNLIDLISRKLKLFTQSLAIGRKKVVDRPSFQHYHKSILKLTRLSSSRVESS